jgi:hypothetical protein
MNVFNKLRNEKGRNSELWFANQTSKDLPKTIETSRVYSAAEGWVNPQSITPETCISNGPFIRLIPLNKL